MRLPRYPKYKDSGVLWLGEVPEHWPLSKLKYFASFCGGGTPSRENLDYWDGEIPWVSPKDMKSERILSAEESVTEAGLRSSATALLSPGRLLMVVRSGILKHTIPVAINDVAVCLNQDMKAVSFATNSCQSEFFLRWVQGLNDQLLLAWSKQGATVESIEHAYLAETVVPLPRPEEQCAIIKFLNCEIGKIDALVEEQRRLIELLKEKRQAVISHAVTKGMNPDAPLKDSGIEWLGQIRSDWMMAAVKGLAKPGKNTFIDGDWVEAPFITEEGIRLIQTGNVGTGFYKEQGFRYVSEESFGVLRCTEIFPNDVLICRLDGPVGRACLVPDLGVRMITSVDNAILKVREDIDPRFVVYLMSSEPWLKWLEVICRVGGGFRVRVSRKMLGDLRIACPPYREQVEIADVLDKELGAINHLVSQVDAGIDLLQERRTALISAAVTGKIDVREMAKAQTA